MRSALLPLVLLVGVPSELAESKVASFDWRNTTDGNLVSAVRNYLSLPGQKCGNIEWSFAATSMISDRLAILEPNRAKVQLSNQVVLNCAGEDTFDGCSDTGSIEVALKYVKENNGIPDRTCMGWRGVKEECNKKTMCVNCLTEGCTPRPVYFKYSISAYGQVDIKSSKAIQEEILKGPIACENKGGDFFSLVAFSGESFTAKYDRGVFYKNGGFDEVSQDNLKECWFANVNTQNLYTDKKLQIEQKAEEFAKKSVKEISKIAAIFNLDSLFGSALKHSLGEGHISKLPSFLRSIYGAPKNAPALKNFTELPEEFTWLNKNILTPIQSHHNGPGYCGACWSLSSASAFSDRLKIASGGKYATDVYVSPQTNIDCIKEGGCNGGGPEEVFTFYKNKGTVDETCNAWMTGQKECDTPCRSCDKDGNCKPVPSDNFKVYKAAGWGGFKGELAMINALQDGPIVCGISSAQMDEMFVGNKIIHDKTDSSKWSVDHDVSVVGYGVAENGEKYWDVRNSWSTSYGDNGMFRITRGTNNLMIEEDCAWVQPLV